MPVHIIQGNALAPREGPWPKIIVHVCNDRGGWGAGFVVAISKKWTDPEEFYRSWAKSGKDFRLGEVQFVAVEGPLSSPGLFVCNMIAQHGYGVDAEGKPPIRYKALRTCLEKVAAFAGEIGASIHMPWIGCGLAGGSKEKVLAIVKEALKGFDITIYEL